MAGGEWERVATEVIIPGLQEAAAELNQRDGIVAQYCEHPFADACILWVARRMSPLPFLSPMGSFAIHDAPAASALRIEQSEPTISGGRPIACGCLPGSAVSAGSVKARALAFAERVLAA